MYCHLAGVSNLAIAVGSTCFFTRPLSAVWDDDDAGSQLADEIRLSIDYYMTQPQAKPVGEVVLSGPGLGRRRARREPRRAPRHAHQRGAAARPARPRADQRPRGSAPFHRGRRSCHGGGGVKAVNLVPSEQRRARPTGNRSGGAYVVVGLLATLLVMVAAYVVTTNKVTENQNDAAAAKAEADHLEAEAAKRASFTNFADIKQARLTSVAAVAGSRFDWERMMRELSLVMPTGSWLQSSDTLGHGRCRRQRDQHDRAPPRPPSSQPKANLVGCTPHQPDVARMMVRMRQMYRVTDVELNQSATEVGVEDETTADSCGRYYQFDLTLTFSEAPAVSEAPRGASRVPVSLGGGS